MTNGPDPYGTAAIRAAALAAWTASPRRLREDANVEDDVARTYGADRVIVELLQNAADAAAREGPDAGADVEIALVVAADGAARLRVSNTGAPLTAEGVAALASVRTSDKGDGDVGRFGVGFGAVRAAADVVVIASSDGAVRFAADTAREVIAAAAAGDAELSATLARRGGDVPVLRLPFPDDARPEPGYTTTVALDLRAPEHALAVRRQLDALDDATLLALPRLRSVTVSTPDGTVRLADAGERWWSHTQTGTLPAELLASRPVEERGRDAWSVTWAVPREPDGPARDVPAVVHAPTPTEASSTVPALLVASFPLEPSRRRIAPGPVTDAIVVHAGEAYAAFVRHQVRRGDSAFRYAPAGLPAGEVDAAIRDAAVRALSRTPVLTTVGGEQVAPRDAVALAGAAGRDPALLGVLAAAVDGLVRIPGGEATAARVLGVDVRDLAGVLDGLGPGGEPGWWRALAEALEPYAAEVAVGEALATLPVPLADGAFARGARGLLVLDDDAAGHLLAATSAFADLGLRVVHPAAAHPLLTRLGARDASAAALLAHDAIAAAVSADADGTSRRDAVLALLATALDDGLDPARVPRRLGTLPLPTAVGEDAPARELVLPGSRAARLFADADRVSGDAVETWGPHVLTALGVRSGLRATTVPDVLAAGDADAAAAGEPEGWAEYLAQVADLLGEGAFLGDVTVIEALDEIADDAWDLALGDIATTPELRAALVREVRGASAARAPSYTSWWLRDRLGAPFAAPGHDVAFLPPAPDLPGRAASVAGLDDEVLTALGAVRTLDELDVLGWDVLLDSLPPAGTEVPLDAAAGLWRALARSTARGSRLPAPPERVVVADAARAMVRDADAVLVADAMTAQLGPHLPAPSGLAGELAELLDLDVRRRGGEVVARGRTEPMPPVLDAVTRVLLPSRPRSWVRSPALTVGGVSVAWWVSDGALLARDVGGLARAIAYAGGAWGWHGRIAAAAAEGPDAVPALLMELAHADR